MAEASIGGLDAPLDRAVAAAAKILGASRCPVIAGLGSDIAGAEAAMALARRLGGAFDHMEGAAALRDLEVMREAGWIVVSPAEARALADLVLLVGPGATGPFIERLRLDAPPGLAPAHKRRVIRLCPGRESAPPHLSEAAVETIGTAAEDLPVMLGMLRARIAGRPLGPLKRQTRLLSGCAEALRAARCGVAVWSAAQLDALTIEMLCGLIDELNAKTRFAGLPLPPDDNAAGVIQSAGWLTGFPIRTGFGRGKPEHDPWRFDAARMVESGEADAALWISACSPQAPAWRRRMPLVVLVAEGARFAAPPDVAFTVGRPGVDHDAVVFDAHRGALAAKPASAPRSAPSVAEILERIANALHAEAAC